MGNWTYYFILSLFITSAAAKAQIKGDSTFVFSSVSKAIEENNNIFKANLHIYNGREYQLYRPLVKEHPYFLSDDFIDSELIFEGNTYKRVATLYDLSNDKLIIQNPNTGVAIEIAANKTEQFTIEQHKFVYLKNNLSPEMTEGFYEVIYEGNMTLYAKRKKTYREHIRGTILDAEFVERSRYYLFVNQNYHRVVNKSSVIKALESPGKKIPKADLDSSIYSTNKLENKLYKMIKFYDAL
jgi:hypothetical protein